MCAHHIYIPAHLRSGGSIPACMYLYIWICVYIQTYVYTSRGANTYIYIYIYIYGRGPTPGLCIYMRPGGTPHVYVCIYAYTYVCVCAHMAWLCVCIHKIPSEIYMYICYRAGSPGSPGEYIHCHRASFTLVRVEVHICTQWREVTLLKIPRFSWFAIHFFEENHVIGKAVGS